MATAQLVSFCFSSSSEESSSRNIEGDSQGSSTFLDYSWLQIFYTIPVFDIFLIPSDLDPISPGQKQGSPSSHVPLDSGQYLRKLRTLELCSQQ